MRTEESGRKTKDGGRGKGRGAKEGGEEVAAGRMSN